MTANLQKKALSIVWLRRDLRLVDNAPLSAALQSGQPVLALFIFDTEILGRLESNDDRRVEFIHLRLQHLDQQLREIGSSLMVRHGKPSEVWAELLREAKVGSVYCGQDYEPEAIERDSFVGEIVRAAGASFHLVKDQVIFEKREVQKDSGGPYTVFTPYLKKWMAKLNTQALRSYPSEKHFGNFLKWQGGEIPTLKQIGFRPSGTVFPPEAVDKKMLQAYSRMRDKPGMNGTSRLGLHLRFGTVSIRKLVRQAQASSEAWLKELVWREFFMQILFHFPHVVGNPFRSEYSQVRWRDDRQQFAAWCEGRTGYPIVDAGMRELNETGYMHNRARMITGSFLTKHLLIDWRWGEAYFARKLLDFDLAANNGNWQWVAGTGCDAAPYFRVFNPTTQLKKFDPKMEYVNRWVPEFNSSRYPEPIVEHVYARERALAAYKAGLAKAKEIQLGATEPDL